MSSIHPTAIIHPDARIGNDVTIDPYVVIAGDVEIGDRTHICSHVTVMDGARIGADCLIYPGAVIAGIPQDLKFRGEKTLAIIGDRTTLRECTTVNRGTASKGKTVVGSDCLIMAYTHIAHDCEVGNGVIISNATQMAGEVIVDDFAVIGGGTMIHQFCHIGGYVMIQGGSLINKDIPPYVKAARDPIAFTGVNVIGLQRRGFSAEQIANIEDIYRCIYRSDRNVTQALECIEEEMEMTAEAKNIVDFIRHADRGILRGYAR